MVSPTAPTEVKNPMLKPIQVRNRLKAAKGYGLAMLMVFVASSLMLATSLQLVAAPVGLIYMGAASQNNLSAKKIAEIGVADAKADIQNRLNTLQTVNTGYTLNNSVNMPGNPAVPGTLNVAVGSYAASLSYARGNLYLLRVIGTVGSASYTRYEVLNLGISHQKPLDYITGSTAAYGLRKLRTTYNGAAVRVRRSSDNAEQDIGFDSNGDLDKVALHNFLGATLPLDTVSGAVGAYSLRKLRAAYTGPAIRVRRSSDNAEQDIGYNSGGDLDVVALMHFVGTGTGFIRTWYDQSGNGNDGTMVFTGHQPSIVINGVLQMVNGRPVMRHIGNHDIRLPRTVGGDMTLIGVYNLISGGGSAPGGDHAWSTSRLFANNELCVGVDGSGNPVGSIGSPNVSAFATTPLYPADPSSLNDGRLYWLAFTRNQTTSQFSISSDRGSFSASNGNTATLNADTLIHWAHLFNGYTSEAIIYNSVLPEANLRTLQRDQARYWNIPTKVHIDRPVDIVAGATAAYGLRKVRTAYAGPAIRVRRSSDNAEQDIGFVRNGLELDTSALLTFVGAGNGFVTTWYDQSGSGLNATQATAGSQPMIVSAGTLETINNRPAIHFAAQTLATISSATWPSGAANRTLNAVYKFSNLANTYQSLVHWGTNSSGTASRLYKSGSELGFFGNVHSVYGAYGLDTTTVHTLTATHNAGTVNVFSDGTLSNTGAVTLNTTANTPLQLGRYDGTHTYFGHLAEVLIYSSALSDANRATIERNQLEYFAPENQTAYVTKWYDQSGNARDVEEKNTLQQPFLSFQGKGGNTTLPTLVFDQRSRLSSNLGFPTSSDYSISTVFSNRGASPVNTAVVSGTSTATAHSMYVSPGSKQLTLWHGGAFAVSGTPLVDNDQYAILATYVHSTRLGTLFHQNTSVGSGTAAASTTNATIRLGAHQDTSYFDGSINEMVIFNKVLSATERSTLYTSQQAAYGSR